MDIKSEIRRCRTATGLSAKALAERADCHPQFVYMLEAGVKDPSLALLRRFAQVFRSEGAPFCSELEQLLGLAPNARVTSAA